MKRYFGALPAALLAAAATVALTATPVAGEQRAVPRDRQADGGGQDSGGSGASGRAVPRGSGSGASAPAPAAPRTSGGGTVTSAPANNTGDNDGNGRAVPPYSRPRGERNPRGEAVSRPANNPPPSGGGTIVVPGSGGYYPWGWGYGGFGLGGYYGFYDPWGYDNYYAPSYYSTAYEGSLRLKIKPRNATVFVDGYFAGAVDDFDGMFQRLRIEPGPHRIEVRADGFEPLTFEVRILPDRTITYESDMKPLP